MSTLLRDQITQLEQQLAAEKRARVVAQELSEARGNDLVAAKEARVKAETERAEIERQLVAQEAETGVQFRAKMELRAELSALRAENGTLKRDRAELAAALAMSDDVIHKFGNWLDWWSTQTRCESSDVYGAWDDARKDWDDANNPKAILAAHDAALVKPLVDALGEQMSFTPAGPCQKGLIPTCRCEKCKNARALTALAPYKERT
jgi:hypothetical protein